MWCEIHSHFRHIHLIHVLLFEARSRIVEDVEIYIIRLVCLLLCSLQMAYHVGIKHVEDGMVVFLEFALIPTMGKELLWKILDHVIKELRTDSLLELDHPI